jgi:hypothetical protein
MVSMSPALRRVPVLVFSAALLALVPIAATTVKDDKPTVSVKASPSIGFAPTRVVLTADVKGGPDDYEQLYCASVEWDMGDGNKSSERADCEPYEAGKSQIKRRYVKDQVFNIPGDYRVQLLLKQKDKVVAVGRTTVKIQPGLRDGGAQ